MSWKRYRWFALGLLGAIAVGLSAIAEHPSNPWLVGQGQATIVHAQEAPPPPPPPGEPTSPAPSSPAPSPTQSPAGTNLPQIPVAPSAVPVPPAPPASTAPPLALKGEYRDPAGQFQVGILDGYTVTPLAGSVLIESPNGNLAYAVVPQAQPLSNPIGFSPDYGNESLVKVATTLLQRGEGFQPEPARPEAGGGVVMNWTGSLTIAGKTQPVGGVVLVRPYRQRILLLVVTATQTGIEQVPGAVSALTNSLQSL